MYRKFQKAGFNFVVDTESDENPNPWEEYDGHGPVSDWRSTDSKSPGELILCTDRRQSLFYDFQEACRIALRDGWDTEPYNTGTRRERAARAARADFERLRRFCIGEWCYIGVIVKLVDDDGDCINSASLWGIESDCTDYIQEVVDELVDELIEEETRKAEEADESLSQSEEEYRTV